jgi:hypothetical protein
MVLAQIEELGVYDTLCIAAHELDAPLSCAIRLAREKLQGRKALVVILFDTEDRDNAQAALSFLGVEQLRLRLPSAAARSRCYGTAVGRMFGRDARDDASMFDRLWPVFDGLRIQTRARQVYLPLGTGEVDHRLAHDVGARIFEAGALRNVLLFEERPYSFAPGAIHMRLARLGSRLPPALTDIGDSSGLLRVLWGAASAMPVRRRVRGVAQRLLYVLRAARAWRQTRGWQPRKAFGVRVQPIIHEVSPETESIARRAQLNAALTSRGRHGSSRELDKCMRRYANRLGKKAMLERYWLVLPPRDADGVIEPATADDPLYGEATGSSPQALASDPDLADTRC